MGNSPKRDGDKQIDNDLYIGNSAEIVLVPEQASVSLLDLCLVLLRNV